MAEAIGTQTAGEALHKGAERAKELGGAAKGQVIRRAEGGRQRAAAELESFAGTLDEVGRSLKDKGQSGRPQELVSGAAKLARKAGKGLREHSSEELLELVERQASDRPGLFVAGGVALGFVLGRLLRMED